MDGSLNLNHIHGTQVLLDLGKRIRGAGIHAGAKRQVERHARGINEGLGRRSGVGWGLKPMLVPVSGEVEWGGTAEGGGEILPWKLDLKYTPRTSGQCKIPLAWWGCSCNQFTPSLTYLIRGCRISPDRDRLPLD